MGPAVETRSNKLAKMMSHPGSLPPQDKLVRGKLTVVLDIDETLVHTSKRQEKANSLDTFTICVFDEVFTVFKRPSLDLFLEKAAAKYELISFTAGIEEYSKAILQEIDPDGKYFKHSLFRQHCAQVSSSAIVKDLRILNRCPTRLVLVDNTLSNFVLQPENGVPITTFVNDAADTALNVLLEFLTCLDSVKDVRVPLRATFQLHELFQLKLPASPVEVPVSGKSLLA